MTTNSDAQINSFPHSLHMAIELAAATWKLGFADRLGRKPRVRSVAAGDFAKLNQEIAAAKKVFKLDPDCPVISCYEAGRDGFWVHRCLLAMGIDRKDGPIETIRWMVGSLSFITARSRSRLMRPAANICPSGEPW